MGSEVREAAVRVGKRRKTCIGWPFVTVLQARQRHARTPAPWVHAGTRAAGTLCGLPCAQSVFTALSSAKHAPVTENFREIKGFLQIPWSKRSEVKIPLRTRHPDTTETKYGMTSPRTLVQCTRVSFMAMRWTD